MRAETANLHRLRAGLRQLRLSGGPLPGCEAAGGQVFHSPEGCPIYRCVREEKGFRDCGQCREIPCRIWQDTRDPAVSDEAFAADIRLRVDNLKR